VSNGADLEDGSMRLVYLVDDGGAETLASLASVLQKSGTCVTSFATGSEFLAGLSTLPPAPIILEVEKPGITSLELLDEIRSLKIDWPVILISRHCDVAVAVEAIKCGASDFLQMPVDLKLIEPAVESAFALLLADNGDRAAASARFESLTKRQAEVIEELMHGKSNKQVAEHLSVSSRTVEMHRAMALTKLGIRTIAEAVTLRSEAN
jgi:two-component system, LuxR family, response regulator FixJ